MSFFIENKNVGNQQDSEDWRIRGYNPLTPPDLLQHEIPQTAESKKTVLESRNEAVAVVNGTDPNNRLLVLVRQLRPERLDCPALNVFHNYEGLRLVAALGIE
ncbi:hypothetical protein NQ176_g4045 [Zarea fungicola]|uniref:Uncharacterized protein n=1 Tax=Zarea fungicola TaxID=93591 RepID=A0ACC1NFB8_9HYPO|nr:hypothetical protein NQ176_g4045 [Lecanicillium fungicola]